MGVLLTDEQKDIVSLFDDFNLTLPIPGEEKVSTLTGQV